MFLPPFVFPLQQTTRLLQEDKSEDKNEEDKSEKSEKNEDEEKKEEDEKDEKEDSRWVLFAFWPDVTLQVKLPAVCGQSVIWSLSFL